MRKYLFIDLHMHSRHSHEEGCEITVEDLLHNANEIVDETRKLLVKKVMAVDNFDLEDLVDELVPYFADDEASQNQIKENILASKSIRTELINNINNNTKCTISITDHQSIEGSREALELIAKDPEKYSAINFITGIEVNAGLRCISKNEEGYSAFKKCHALAYNYDINDDTFNAYSKLYNFTIPKVFKIHKRELTHKEVVRKDRKTGEMKSVLKSVFEDVVTEKEVNMGIGKMVIFAKKKIADFTNDVIPMEKLTYLTNLTSLEQVKNVFMQDVIKKYPNLTKEQINKIDSCFDFTQNGNDLAVQGSKWELNEYMDAIKKAGGQFSIAHPYSIKRKRTETQDKKVVDEFIDTLKRVTKDENFELYKDLEFFDKESIRENISAVNVLSNKRYSADEIYKLYIDFTYSKDIQEFVERIIDIRKDNDFGFEIFNKLNINGAKGKVLYDVAKKYDLYLTGGSDHHGPNICKDNILSSCFDSQFIYNEDNLFEMQDNELQRKIDKTIKWSTDNFLTEMPYIEFLKNKNYKCNRQEISFYNRLEGQLSLSNNLFDRNHTWIVKANRPANKCKVIYARNKFTHIPRKDFEYVGDKQLEKDVVPNKVNNYQNNLEDERLKVLTQKFEQESLENERINNLNNKFENNNTETIEQKKINKKKSSLENKYTEPEVIEVSDDELTLEDENFIL